MVANHDAEFPCFELKFGSNGQRVHKTGENFENDRVVKYVVLYVENLIKARTGLNVFWYTLSAVV